MYKNVDKIKKWLSDVNITKYEITKDLITNVNEDVILLNRRIKKIPIQFGIVNGNFFAQNNRLITLQGSPKIVNGIFDVTNNEISSLNYAPKYIKDNFYMDKNPLIFDTIDDFTIEVENFIVFSENFKDTLRTLPGFNSFFSQRKGNLVTTAENFKNFIHFVKVNNSIETIKLLVKGKKKI